MIRLVNPATGAIRDLQDREATACRILIEAGWLRVESEQQSTEPELLLPEVVQEDSGIPPRDGRITPLPKNMPGYQALVKAGMYTVESLRGLGEKELAEIPGIGKRTAVKIATRVELHYANRSDT